MQIFDSYAELIQRIRDGGHEPRILGCAPDGSPIISVRVGGDREPAIFISAGSHSTEHAGVSAAVELIDTLDTEHRTYILPCRDPIGLNGYRYALSLGLGQEPDLESIDDLSAFLRDHGEVLHEEDDLLVAIIGEYGYATRGMHGWSVAKAPGLEALRGRRLFFTLRSDDVEGSAPLQRAYTLIVDPDGEVLHINRFHDTGWAPSEPRCTRDLMAEIRPGLTLDLHEHGGDAFWFSARHQRNDDDEAWEKRMADAIIGAVTDSGAALMPEEYLPGSFFTKGQRSVYWLNPQERGEGLNLADFGACEYGPAFTIETGMRTGFQNRVQTSMLAARTAIGVFEERHA
ncbi:MAG: hypothetical protein QGI83_12850 [Candidatus Latescibacteria bacterium]|jgi:hypothetical protein|nr:hypothetical protein [Candidatus Latescibacterota bacterium]